MEQKVFSVYDEKAEAFLPPFFLPTIGIAARAMTDCVNDPGHQFAKHPSDYTLFLLAEFDDSTGYFHEMKKPLGSLVEYKNSEQVVLEKGLEIVK